MRIRGRTSHCETEPRAGQRKAARGNEGVRTRASGFAMTSKVSVFLSLRRGLWAGAAMIYRCIEKVEGSVVIWLEGRAIAQTRGRLQVLNKKKKATLYF